MKKLIVTIILILFYCQASSADVYVVYDKSTKEIISISNENDCVVQASMKEKIIKGMDISDILITYPPQYYKLKGNKLVANMAKIAQKEKADLEAYNKAQEEALINKRMKKLAIQALESEGVEFKYQGS